MRYTPVELRHVKMGRSLFGYRRPDTDRLLEDVADSFEEVWCERGELADKLEETTKQLTDFKEREALLANTLVSAEKAASEAKELARKEVELMISEAHQEARSITRVALTERERLFAEARRVETLLRSALGMVEETGKVPEQAGRPRLGRGRRELAEAGGHPRSSQPSRSRRSLSSPSRLSCLSSRRCLGLSETPASDLGEDDDDEGSPLPPPLPPAAQEPADVDHAEEPDPDQEPNVEVPWTGRNTTSLMPRAAALAVRASASPRTAGSRATPLIPRSDASPRLFSNTGPSLTSSTAPNLLASLPIVPLKARSAIPSASCQ